MTNSDVKMVPLYQVVESVGHVVSELQGAIDRNQDDCGYNKRRANPRTANVRRVARIWSEGQLTEMERNFDLARDQPERFLQGQQGQNKKTGKGKQTPPLELARQDLMQFWQELRGDTGFHYAKTSMRRQTIEAGDTARKLEKEGKKLERELSRTMDVIRDLKQGLAQGIRNVPFEPALAPGINVPLPDKVAAIRRTGDVVAARLASAGAGPANRPTPSPSIGRGGTQSEEER